MFGNKKVIVVMPAYNAEKTIRKTYDEVMAQGIVDLVVIVDDASKDGTVEVASKLPHAVVHTHSQNLGYAPTRRPAINLLSKTGPIS